MNETEQAKGFGWFLQQIQSGDFHHECSEKLRELNAAMNQHVQDYGGKPKGKITVEIAFQLDKGAFQIDAEIKCKLPKKPTAGALMWSTAGNNFAVEHPRQPNLFEAPRGAARAAEPVTEAAS